MSQPKPRFKIVRGDEAKQRYFGKPALAYGFKLDATNFIKDTDCSLREFNTYDKITDTFKDEWFCVVIDDTPTNNEYGEVCP